MNTIPKTPIESLSQGLMGVWDCLKTPQLESELATRRRVTEWVSSPFPWHSDAFCNAMAELLSNGHQRLLLYLPEHFIPKYNDKESSEATNNYAETIVKQWNSLLNAVEPLANYTNGDTSLTKLISPAAIIARLLIKKELISVMSLSNQSIENIVSDNLTPELPTARSYDHKRNAWLEWERKRLLIRRMGKLLSDNIHIEPPLPHKIVPPTPYKRLSTQIYIAAIGYAIERDPYLYHTHKDKLYKLYEDSKYRDEAIIVLTRLRLLGHKIDIPITIPNFTESLSNNLEPISDKIEKYKNIVTTDQELQDIIYPIVIVYGSRLKGYGLPTSDIDLAVLVRPNVACRSTQQIETIINSRLPNPTLYQLVEHDGILDIIEWLEYQKSGAPYDSHVLFNGVWIGDIESQKLLCAKLLKPITTQNSAVRAILLKELERDLLQYRLLHRGYETYFSPTTPTFLDDGYRLMATKLYLNYILLP